MKHLERLEGAEELEYEQVAFDQEGNPVQQPQEDGIPMVPNPVVPQPPNIPDAEMDNDQLMQYAGKDGKRSSVSCFKSPVYFVHVKLFFKL